MKALRDFSSIRLAGPGEKRSGERPERAVGAARSGASFWLTRGPGRSAGARTTWSSRGGRLPSAGGSTPPLPALAGLRPRGSRAAGPRGVNPAWTASACDASLPGYVSRAPGVPGRRSPNAQSMTSRRAAAKATPRRRASPLDPVADLGRLPVGEVTDADAAEELAGLAASSIARRALSSATSRRRASLMNASCVVQRVRRRQPVDPVCDVRIVAARLDGRGVVRLERPDEQPPVREPRPPEAARPPARPLPAVGRRAPCRRRRRPCARRGAVM